MDSPAFQAECREFEPRLPLHFHDSCLGRHDNWTDGLLSDLVMSPNRVLQRSTTRYEAAIRTSTLGTGHGTRHQRPIGTRPIAARYNRRG